MFDRYRANRPKRSVLEQVPGLDMFEEDSPVVSIAEIVAALAAGSADEEPPPPPPRIAAQAEMEKLEGQIRQHFSKLQRLMAEYDRLKAFLGGKPAPKIVKAPAPVAKPQLVAAKPQPPVAKAPPAAAKPAPVATKPAAPVPSVSAVLPEVTPEAIALAKLAAAEAELPTPDPNPPVPVRVPAAKATEAPQPVPRSKYTAAALAAEPRGKSLAPRRRAPGIAAE
jgi:hypothetical protein